jgi:ATP-dependent Clp protease ATP-binding subunit ClpX
MIPVDTKNILFICGGAFEGIDRKIGLRLNTKVVGYKASLDNGKFDRNNLLQYVSPQDLRSFGLIPEIVGRLPVLTYLIPLEREALRRILTDPKNSIIKQYEKLFKMDGIKITFPEETLYLIVDKAIEFKLGARGLRAICETVIMDVMFEMPSGSKTEIVITPEFASEKIDKLSAIRLKAG